MGATETIDGYIADLGDWRGQRISQYRDLIKQVCPDIQEEWKWDVPVFALDKSIMAMAAFKDYIKINFFKGAQLADPQGLFNSGLESKMQRSINITEDMMVDQQALSELIAAAIALEAKR